MYTEIDPPLLDKQFVELHVYMHAYCEMALWMCKLTDLYGDKVFNHGTCAGADNMLCHRPPAKMMVN